MSYYRQQGNPGLTPAVKNLVIINVLVWLILNVLDKSNYLQLKLSLFPLHGQGVSGTEVFKFEPYQVFTHMFVHYDFMHLLFNMFSLYIFGTILERVWGSKRFLFFYLVCGLGAAALHLLVQELTNEFSFAQGASGAVMGCMAAFAYLFPNTPMMFFPFPFPIKAVYMALIFIGIDLFGGLGRFAGDRIAHFAHLGGAITGFILVLIWNKRNKKTFY